jgi:hypothetical protein
MVLKVCLGTRIEDAKQMSNIYMDDVTTRVIIADEVITYVIIDDDISS